MAGSVNNACWASNLDLSCRDDDSSCGKSTTCEDDKPGQTSVGPFMCSLFEKQLYTDVDFVSKHSKEVLSAHRVVLAAKCTHFESSLFGKQNGEASGLKIEMEISYKPFSVFKDIIKYLYTGDIRFSDVSYVLDTYAISQRLEIQELVYQCEEYLEALELTEDNVCSTLQVSNEKCAEQLTKRCTDYIKNNTLQVISSAEFEKCSFNTVREICDLQDLNLESEAKMLEAVMRWIKVHPLYNQSILKQSLMKCIRFLSFSARDFGDAVKRYPDLLPNGEALAILMYLNNPASNDVKELPDWVNRGYRSLKRDIQAGHQNAKGSLKIPLKPASKPLDMTRLTSILQMNCFKGTHVIDAVKFSLGDISNHGNKNATIVVHTLVTSARKRLSLCFTKTMDSKETTLVFDRGIFVSRGQTFHLKVQFKSNEACRFLQFDDSKNNFANEHFSCSIKSIPVEDRYFIVDEIEYRERARNFRRARGYRDIRNSMGTEKGIV